MAPAKQTVRIFVCPIYHLTVRAPKRIALVTPVPAVTCHHCSVYPAAQLIDEEAKHRSYDALAELDQEVTPRRIGKIAVLKCSAVSPNLGR